MQRPTWPTAVRDPSSSDLLPLDDAEWDRQLYDTSVAPSLHVLRHDQKDLESKVPPLVSTSSHVRVGYFARLAQVSHLLGLVLNNKHSPTSDSNFNSQETQQLRRTVAVYAELLPKEASATDCSHYCGPIAICQWSVDRHTYFSPTDTNSAQQILEQSIPRPSSGGDPVNDFDGAADMISATVVQMAEQLNVELAVTRSDLLRPLAIPSIYQVAQIYVRLSRRDPNPRYKHGIQVLLQTLGFFEQRWKVAGMLPYWWYLQGDAHPCYRRVQRCNYVSTLAVRYEHLSMRLFSYDPEMADASAV